MGVVTEDRCVCELRGWLCPEGEEDEDNWVLNELRTLEKLGSRSLDERAEVDDRWLVSCVGTAEDVLVDATGDWAVIPSSEENRDKKSPLGERLGIIVLLEIEGVEVNIVPVNLTGSDDEDAL